MSISDFWAGGGRLNQRAWMRKDEAIARSLRTLRGSGMSYEDMTLDEWAALPSPRRRAAFREVYGFDEPAGTGMGLSVRAYQ